MTATTQAHRRDRTRPLSQEEIEQELWRLSVFLEDTTNQLPDVATEAAQAESDWKRGWLQRYARSSGGVKDRELTAQAECSDLYERFKLAEARHKAMVESLRTIRDQMSAIQTMAANVRHQV